MASRAEGEQLSLASNAVAPLTSNGMLLLKLFVAAALLCTNLVIAFPFAMTGIASPLAFGLFAVGTAIYWRVKHGPGSAWVYLGGYAGALVLEGVLVVVVIGNRWLGVHKIFEGYGAPMLTQLLLAVVPVVAYVQCLRKWASRP